MRLSNMIRGREMYNPVISNEYEIALHIIKGMLQKVLISRAEFDRIDAENRKTFINI